MIVLHGAYNSMLYIYCDGHIVQTHD